MENLVALDLGHKDTKSTVNGRNFDKFPSVIAPAVGQSFQAFGAGATTVEVDGRSWLVGEDAEVESRQVEQTIDRDRTQSIEYKVLALTALARLYPHGMANINLVTGLPNGELDDSGDVANQLAGQHNIKVNGKTIGFGIKNIDINPQSFGTLCSQAFELQNGSIAIADDNILSKTTLYFDLGSRTINFMQFVGKRYIQAGSDSEPQGVYRIAERLTPVINREFRLEYDLYQTLVALERGYVMVKGSPQDITDLAAPFVSELVDLALSRSLRIWPKRIRDEAHAVFVSGGGTFLAGPELRERFPHNNVILCVNPVFSNVSGYYIYGLWLSENNKWK